MTDAMYRFSRRVLSLFTIPRDNPELVQAKLAAFSRQVPIMYALVVFNTLAVAYTHLGRAPNFLTLYFPGLLDVICILRTVIWFRSRRRQVTLSQAISRLRSTIMLAGLLALAFLAWSIALFPYGDAYMNGQVMFFTGVTVLGCGFCLMHLRPAAIIVISFVVMPFACFLAWSGNAVLIAIACNFVIVSTAVTFMLLRNYQDFERRVASEKALRAKQAELQAMSDTNFRNAHGDVLTGLPNRRSFFLELDRRIGLAASSGGKLLLCVLDLDGFKPVNDLHGHYAGDRLLAEVSFRLRQNMAPQAFIGRLGGDEFVVISEQPTPDEPSIPILHQLSSLFDTPFVVDGLNIRVGCSIGYAKFPDAAKTGEELFERADFALIYGKQNARGTAVAFNAEHETIIRDAGAIDRELLNADFEKQLWIAYQPIVDAVTLKPRSFEALARWHNPVLGDVSPLAFITAAERSGLIGQMTPILLRKALKGAELWPEDVGISFNLSALDVSSARSINAIVDVVEQSGIGAHRIDFEITETAVMRNMAESSNGLGALRRLGARISLDDFGTGYSSLSCIRGLPLDTVKIDRSFIADIDTDPAARLILKSLLYLCARLKLACVVEGVETQQQMQFLQTEGCRLMQGFLFAKPMSATCARSYVAGSEIITSGMPRPLDTGNDLIGPIFSSTETPLKVA
jgi:diguanylate cyclase (GGDEF)-like protein